MVETHAGLDPLTPLLLYPNRMCSRTSFVLPADASRLMTSHWPLHWAPPPQLARLYSETAASSEALLAQQHSLLCKQCAPIAIILSQLWKTAVPRDLSINRTQNILSFLKYYLTTKNISLRMMQYYNYCIPNCTNIVTKWLATLKYHVVSVLAIILLRFAHTE